MTGKSFDGEGSDRSPIPALRILDVGGFLAGPMVATFLGDFGADVIKVERPGRGDPNRVLGVQPPGKSDMSYQSQVESRNKRSVTLNLSDPRGKDLLLRLVEGADILVENFRPGVMDRLGLGYDDLSKVNDRLVYVSVSGFGQVGPYRGLPALDYVGAAFSGFMYLTGSSDGPPMVPGYPVTDYLGGAFGAMAALEAVRRRDTPGGTGKGEWIDVALYEPLLRFSTPLIPVHLQEGRTFERNGSYGAFGTVFSYRTADDHWIATAPVQHSDAFQERLLRLIGREELLADPRYASVKIAKSENVDGVHKVVAGWTAANTLRDVLDGFAGAEIPCSRINTMADICADPFVQERSLVTVPDHEGNDFTMQGPIPRFVNHPLEVRWLGPRLGEANEEVLVGELGLSPGEYEELRRVGVV